MKTIFMVQTFDGLLHKTEDNARRHLDALYSNTVSNLAARLVLYSEGKYQKTKDWLDENLPALIEANRIKDDMIYEPETGILGRLRRARD